jgi:CxxC motif-containing protein
MSERLTCVLCPIGCQIEADRRGDDLEVRGNECPKGVDFAVQEILHPMRNLSASVPLKGAASRMVSVRLSVPVPRDKIFPILALIAELRPEAPVRRGEVLIADVLDTGADVIATRTVKD